MNTEQLWHMFNDPPNDYRALPMNLRINDPEELIKKLKSEKWGGTHFQYPRGRREYLRSEEGWTTVISWLEYCRENGFNAWIYDENGYPSGRAGGNTLEDHPEFEAQGLFYDYKDIEAIKVSREICWSLPEGIPFYVVLCPLDNNGWITGERTDLTNEIKDGKVIIQIQPGSWRLIALVRNRLYRGTHAEKTGGSYINILDPDAVKQFIDVTYEAFYDKCGDYFGSVIKAFFNDEVSLMSGYLSGDTQMYQAVAWYSGLPEIFRKHCGYDIRECLPSLFDNAAPDASRLRCDFYSTLAKQIGYAFFKQVSDWCSAHGIVSTGHLLWEESLVFHTSFYGSVFPSLKEIDWPGIDVLGCKYAQTCGAHTEGGPVTPKLISSSAHLYNKTRTMSESFCFVTNKIPMDNLISHINWQWVLGINSLTIIGIHKQYTAKELSRMNDYTGRLSLMLTQGMHVADIAVLYPITSVWSNFIPTRRHIHHLTDYPKAYDVDRAWRLITEEVLSCPGDFDYIDEDIVMHSIAVNGKLKFNNCSYSVIILPHVTCMYNATLKKLIEFASGGGIIIAFETLPWLIIDGDNKDENRSAAKKLWNHPNFVHTETQDSFRSELMKSRNADLIILPSSRDIYYQHRITPEKDIYFVVNNSLEEIAHRFTFAAAAPERNNAGIEVAEIWDPISCTRKKVFSINSTDKLSVDITLPPRSGYFVIF